MRPKVGIVYLTYNNVSFIEEVVASIETLSYPKESLLFIAIDNASTDGSAEKMREAVVPKANKTLPEVAFFPMSENTGFAGGCNIGIEHALLAGCEYVYLLNPDAKLHPNAIEEAVRLMEARPEAGSVQSLMRLWQEPEKTNSTGGAIHVLGFGFVRDNGKHEKDIQVTDGEEIAFASGAAVLYRAKALQDVGLLDAHLFIYHEDLEFGWRLRLGGWKNLLSTRSVVYHHYEFSRSIKKLYWMERNRLLVHLSHFKLPTLLLLALPMLCLELALLAFALKGGWWRQKLMAWRDLLSPISWNYLAETRTKMARLRRTSDREILRLFTGKIEHQETANVVVEKFANPILALYAAVLKRVVLW